MIKFLKKLRHFGKTMLYSYCLRRAETAALPRWTRPEVAGGKVFLAQAMSDYYFVLAIGHMSRVLRERTGYSPRWITQPISAQSRGRSGLGRITGIMLHNSQVDAKWIKIYQYLAGGELAWRNNQPCSLDFTSKAQEIVASLRNHDDLDQLRLEGLEVGDLIYDSYIRFRPAPTVDLKDPFLVQLVASTLEVIHHSRKYLDRQSVEFYLTPYTAYVQLGITLRECLRRGIPCYCFGVHNYFLRRVEPLLPRTRADYPRYPEIFAALPGPEERLRQARHQLESRFSGNIDSATRYVKASAYRPDAELPPALTRADPRPVAVVFMHCFFDSPHIYRDMLFSDFLQWIHFLLSRAPNSSYRFVVKPHPSSLPANATVVEELKLQYPEIDFISPQTSNLSLIRAGIQAVFTVYGTVGHEFPWFGIPVCCAGDNPHAAYRFCHMPQSREELAVIVENPGCLRKPDDSDRRQIEEFYYMHNLYHHPGQLVGVDLLGIAEYQGASDTPAYLAWHSQHKPAMMDQMLLHVWDEVHPSKPGSSI